MNDMPKHEYQWQAKWIRNPGLCLSGWRRPVLPAPYLRKCFSLNHVNGDETVRLCGLGFYELYVNGKKVGDQVLDPVVTHYDKRVRYVTHNVASCLQKGENVIGAILGNGFYNSHTAEVWHFDKAPWRDYPKLLLQMDSGSGCILMSDPTWKTSTGPILFDGLRNGETYDARNEMAGWAQAGFDDSAWDYAERVNPPGGILEEQSMPPCKVMKTLAPTSSWSVPGATVYDLGQNMTGWARITVRGDAGARITLRYGECLTDDRHVDQSKIAQHILAKDMFQTDQYILKGGETETWEPRFTYHGFQYVQVSVDGQASLEKLEGRVVHTAFEKTGNFSCSDETVNRLQTCTEWSYIGNFVGIPTDCPHREKNGWTADAHLAAETGLFNYGAASAYAQWIDSIADAQRPSGQLPGIVPCCGWGYNWGSGPAWDSAFLLIPWYLYVYTGDTSVIRKHYGAMKRYVDYCSSMAEDGIVSFGLGDWCHPDPARMADRSLTDTGYYYADAKLLAAFAGLTGNQQEESDYNALTERIKAAFNQRFYKGNGLYARGEQTALGCALYHGLVEPSERESVIRQLVDAVEVSGGKLDFGILGAKYIPRVLADAGHAELAFSMITQPEYPGWVHWLQQGATTLWESWANTTSRNHIMFGDISAWFYQYLAGIVPDDRNPGFRHFTLRPQFVRQVDWVKAEHRSPRGKIVSAWHKTPRDVKLEFEIPAGSTATLELPGVAPVRLPSGLHQLSHVL